jgi:nucleotide-binding universal stress UspA family protein
MSIRVVLIPLFGSETDAFCLGAGLSVAQRFGAHAEGLFVRSDPADVIPAIGEGVSPAIVMQLTQAAAAELERQSAAARGALEAACAQAGIARAQSPGKSAASARWIERTGRRDEMIPRRARVSDLTVLARPDDQAPPELNAVVQATLLGAGRPLLIVPPGGAREFGRSVAIAWDGGTEAARAVGWALPFLEAGGAAAVHCLTAQTRRTHADVAVDLAEYLEWRAIACERHGVAAQEGEAVGAALLRVASDIGADLLVMGGYGRSRLSELVLGGVTRHVLAAAELPLLISH